MPVRDAIRLFLVLSLFAGGGCSDRSLRPLEPCTVTAVVRQLPPETAQAVDLLFVIDDSGSMADEQAALAAQLENVVSVLLTGEIPGREPFPPVSSLRVGVVRSDMGVLGVGTIPTALDPAAITTAIPSCGADAEAQFFGADGRVQLMTAETPPPSGCEAQYPHFLQFDVGDDVSAFVDDVGCTARVGTGGCGFEMQLEAMLAAVTDSSRPGAPAFAPTVADGAPRDRGGQRTPGQANEGFFRESSVIAVVVITDEEDCSTDDPELFMFSPAESALQDPAHADPATEDLRVNTRCLFFDERLHSIERYVEGLRALRPDAPGQIVFAAIVGVPSDLDGASADAILADPRMAYTDVLAADGTIEDANARWGVFTEPACFRCATDPSVTDFRDCPDDADPGETGPDRNEDLQWAAPGRRFVELAARLEEESMGSVVRSICTDDFGPAMSDILERIGEALTGACLPRPLHPDATGLVPCDVVEVLPPGVRCADRAEAGREPTPVRIERSEEGEREVCRLNQVQPTRQDRELRVAPDGMGWFYDDYTALTAKCGGAVGEPRQRIGFTEGAVPVYGAAIRLECLQPVQGGELEGADLAEPCATDAECAFSSVEDAERFVERHALERDRFIDAAGNLTGESAMRCEPVSKTCQIACADASDCPGGFACASPGAEPSAGDACAAGGCFCLNPTCAIDAR